MVRCLRGIATSGHTKEVNFMIDNPLNKLYVKRGEELPQSKLTESNVIEARKLHSEYLETIKDLHDMFSIRALAIRYGVSKNAMEKAIAGITWSHIA